MNGVLFMIKIKVVLPCTKSLSPDMDFRTILVFLRTGMSLEEKVEHSLENKDIFIKDFIEPPSKKAIFEYV